MVQICELLPQGRSVERLETLVTGVSGSATEPSLDLDRLSYAKIDGPNVTLAYMADTKTHVSSPMFIDS